MKKEILDLMKLQGEVKIQFIRGGTSEETAHALAAQALHAFTESEAMRTEYRAAYNNEPEPQDDRLLLLKMIESEYDLIGSWWGNGCDHGFKPAKDCQNENCERRKMHRLWDNIFKG